MELSSQRLGFSTDPSTKGFDNSAGDRWIYPENYPVRDYQFNIVKSALYHNTLVCLPTGLGKTFIAAVVMYNFWRWYPRGKIIFLAPTKPLVAQQINACHEIMGIAREETVELTGATDQKKRQLAWSETSRARVVFATPQVFHKDLEKDIIPTDVIKCVVVDEAHRALGKHSYCESIRLLSEKSRYFRILGLSATPGGKLEAVHEVVKNLHIEHLELRDERSPDIVPYINERKLDIILVGLGGDLEQFKDRYIIIMDRHVRVLVNNNIIRGNTGNLSKGRIYLLNKAWHQRPNKGSNHGQITKTLMILMTMYHAYELMIRHGLRAFCNFYHKHEDKFWLSDEPALLQLVEEINYFLGPFPDIGPMPDGSFPVIPTDIRFGHNKFHKLKELLERHFERYENREEDTRAIVFVEFRDIVNEVYVMLLQSLPLLRPQKFVGQAGQKQKQQKQALEDFRSNKVNVLISTSVGEEGLDVGEVDLIVCFDISQQSPIRLVQRMGRTGRKRDGHIIVLVTDGKEHQTLTAAMSRRDSLNSKVLHSSGIVNALYKESPRMVPDEFNPECRKTTVTVQPSNIAGPSRGKGKTKETRKPRKRAENGNKTKNSKNPDPSASQSLMRFLKKTREDTEMDIGNEIVTLSVNEIRPSTSQASQQNLQSINTVKFSNVKLLTCDDAAVDFLTFCTMKKSQNEQTNIDCKKTNPYLPSYHDKTDKIKFNFEIPDLRILDCLKDLTMYVEPTPTNDNDEEAIEEVDYFWPIHHFDDRYDLPNFHENPDKPHVHARFEALLDESTDDSEKTIFQPTETEPQNAHPVTEKVDWSENVDGYKFEDLLDEWSDETRMSDGKGYLNEKNTSKSTNYEVTGNSVVKSGRFEDILNEDSTTSPEKNDSSEKYECNEKNKFDPRNNRTASNSPMKLGLFEGLLNEDSTTSFEKNESNGNHECKGENKIQTTNDGRADITPGNFGRFEDLLNDESRTSVGENKSDAITVNLSKKSGNFEDLLNDDWETSSEKNDSDATIDGITRMGAFEDLLNDESSTRSENNDGDEKNNADNNVNKGTTINTCRKFGAFEDILDSSSNDSETQFEMELIPERIIAESSPLKSRKTTIDDEIPDEFIARDARNEKIAISNASMDTLELPNETIVPRQFIGNIDDESIDLLEDYEERGTKMSDNEKINLKIVSDIEVSSINSVPINRTPENSESQVHLNTVAREFGRIKGASTKQNIANDELVNIEARDHVSSVLADVQSDIWNSRFSANTSSRETLCLGNGRFEEKTESDDDIFGNDDLMVDSDFEEQINIIEKSAEQSLSTSEKQDSCVSTVKNISPKKTSDEREGAKQIVESPPVEVSGKNHGDRDNKDNKDRNYSPRKSFRLELNLDNCKSKIFQYPNDNSRKVDDDDDNGKSEERKDSKSSPAKSFRLAINCENSDWNSQVFRVRDPSTEKLSEKTIFFSNSRVVDTKNSVALSESDLNLDDCDWDSNDFETFTASSRASTSNDKIINDQVKSSTKIFSVPSKSEAKEIRDSDEFVNITGWLTTEKPKSRLTLSKKLSRIICKSSKRKETNEKPSPRRDSDSENDFTVSRLEINDNSKNRVVCDYFAKPNPVSAITRPKGSSIMNTPLRSSRGPLSLRRNEPSNKIETSDLKKIPEIRDTVRERSVGVGRQKSVSCDLDVRKRKRESKHRKRARARSEFIDDEAEFSSDRGHTSESSGCDDDLEDFVSYTQTVDDNVDMHAHYLQTVRSPRVPGGFFIRKPRSPSPGLQIYSQTITDEPNNYLYDSFCVDENAEVFDESATSDEITRIEELEKRRKKRKRSDSTDSRVKRKRKLIAPTSETTSSEDETEKLRRQIQEESYALKN